MKKPDLLGGDGAALAIKLHKEYWNLIRRNFEKIEDSGDLSKILPKRYWKSSEKIRGYFWNQICVPIIWGSDEAICEFTKNFVYKAFGGFLGCETDVGFTVCDFCPIKWSNWRYPNGYLHCYLPVSEFDELLRKHKSGIMSKEDVQKIIELCENFANIETVDPSLYDQTLEEC